MSDGEPSPAFTTALANGQFILQSVASTTVSEGGSRTAVYLSSLSSGLVALGFASGAPASLPAFLFTVLPTVFLLGCFTVVRLVDVGVESLTALARLERIRRYWATLDPSAPDFFLPDEMNGRQRGVRYGRWAALFTMASVIVLVNAVVGGAIAALLLVVAARLPASAAVAPGVLVGVALAVGGAVYQRRRLSTALAVVTP